MKRQSDNQDEWASHDTDKHGYRDWVYSSSWFALGFGAAAYLWMIVSFAVQVAHERVHSWWPFPPPGGNSSWAEIIMAGLTGAFFLIAVLQWRVTQHILGVTSGQLQQSRSATKLTLRAWVLAAGIKPLSLTAEMGIPAARLRLRNYGASPALRWSRSHRFAVDYPGAPFFTGPAPAYFEAAHGFSIAPQATLITDLPMSGDLTGEEIEDVEDGKATLWLVVRYGYTDLAGTKGTSVYYWRYIAANGSKRAQFVRWWAPDCGDW